jgi:hypothetical protein
VVILNANPQADALHPDAIYRLAIDNDGDLLNDIAFSYVFWGRCSARKDGKLLHVDRAGHPSVSSFFNTDETKEEYNGSEPVNDRQRWTDLFVHLMGHTGHYTREEAIAAIDAHGICPTC